MAENGQITKESKKRASLTFEAKVMLLAEHMLQQNKERTLNLFRDYDPMNGDGAPGPRRLLVISDLYLGESASLSLPIEMFSVGLIYQIALCGSIEETCYSLYGEYDETLRDTVVRSFLKTWAKHDFYFFSYAYARIKNKEGGEDVPFKLNAPQIKLAETFEEQRRAGKPIRVILLKARQWGGSTCTQIYLAWIQLFWVKSWNSIIVGHQGDSAAEVKDMYIKLITQLPDFLFYEEGVEFDEDAPKIKGGGTTNISLIPARNCKIKTATAMNPEGARGGDSAMAHCTEVAFWPQTEKFNPQKQVKSSCSGILYKPLTVIVYESTANGQNFYKDEWDRAHAYDEHGEKLSAFVPLFVAWWEIEKYTQQPDDLFHFACILINRKNDKKNHYDYLYWLWTIGATLQGIYWYWNKMREYADIQDMQQEYPSDEVEAFKYSGTLEFDSYKVEQLRKFCRKPMFRGEIFGNAPKGEAALQNLHLEEHSAGELSIWELPDNRSRLKNQYFVSVDIGGRYKTSDNSVITVFNREDMMLADGVLNEDSGPSVVAEWCGHTDPDLLAIKCAQIAKFYNNALLIVENNTAYSKLNDVDTDNVSELFFPILIPLYDNVYSHNRSELDKGMTAEVRWGFNTNRSTKVSIIKYMGQCIRDVLYIERNVEAVKEFSYYMKFPNGKYGAIPGKHDDRVMSRSIGLYVSRFEWDRYPVKLMPTAEERLKNMQRMRNVSTGIECIVNN